MVLRVRIVVRCCVLRVFWAAIRLDLCGPLTDVQGPFGPVSAAGPCSSSSGTDDDRVDGRFILAGAVLQENISKFLRRFLVR